ncbi:MAG: NAD(P)/FAD-dependent oxidoreductase [Clostridia bacterium]|nr:NAD(P)/FAD-dependent oxidoreductase [Clostridia bacterium]
MGKKIVVAGAGHGGLIAAAKLAQAGYDVTVYERRIKSELGYDWEDAINLHIFAECGLETPDTSNIEFNGDMKYYNPNLKAPLVVPSNGKGSAMFERKKLYEILLDNAEKSGVRIIYSTEILGPVTDGLRVTGIRTSDGVVDADLVIDAAGINTPLRSRLPVCCNVDRDYGYGECFYAYRAYFNKVPGHDPDVGYEIFLMHQGERGISWVVTKDSYVDVLIGRMAPMSKEKLRKTLDEMRAFSPQIGETLLRGGSQEQIPVRRPLSVMVCDGYAAVGDSAYMTEPMSGSGICASMRAGLLLAETVIADEKEEYSKETLWEYNRKYMLHFGKNFAAIDILKNVLLCTEVEGVNFLFDKGIITENDMSFGTGKSDKGMAFSDLVARATRGIGNLPVLLRTAGALSKGDNVKKVYEAIPKTYNEKAVLKWKADVREATTLMQR